MKNTPPSAQTEWEKEFINKFSNDIFYGVATFFKDEHGNLDRAMGKKVLNEIIGFISKTLVSERTCLLSLESMKMEPETYIEPCENCGGEGYGRAWTGHGRATGEAFGDRYEPTHSFVFCKECAPQFTIGKDWMGEEIWKRTSDRKENAQIRINSITRVSKEAKARNLLRQSILSEMEKGDDK